MRQSTNKRGVWPKFLMVPDAPPMDRDETQTAWIISKALGDNPRVIADGQAPAGRLFGESANQPSGLPTLGTDLEWISDTIEQWPSQKTGWPSSQKYGRGSKHDLVYPYPKGKSWLVPQAMGTKKCTRSTACHQAAAGSNDSYSAKRP